MSQKVIETSAPGRICLFGEHQDYLQLPVITTAINLHIKISGHQNNDSCFKIDLPDIGRKEEFKIPSPGNELGYVKERDYFRSVFNVLLRNGSRFQNGWTCTVRGNIPINSGTSSSSALCVAWTKFLIEANSLQKAEFHDNVFVGRMAYLAEVEEFGEPGGMMDHLACAVGGVLYQDFRNKVSVESLSTDLDSFVLGDSLEPKNTLSILHRVKNNVLQAMKDIQNRDSTFKLETSKLEDLRDFETLLSQSQIQVLKGTILNRDITRKAKHIFNKKPFNELEFGNLLNEHQKVLANLLKISTPKIDRMLRVAIKAGASGGKINGSGGGGCMFAYAPENSDKVAKAIERCGAEAYIVNVSD